MIDQRHARADAVTAGFVFGALHCALSLLTQAQKLLFFSEAPTSWTNMLWAQPQHILVSLALAGLVAALWRSLLGRAAAVLVFTACNFVVVVDVSVYAVMGTQLEFSMLSEYGAALPHLLDSVIAEIDPLALLNTCIVGALAIVVCLPHLRRRLVAQVPYRGTAPVLFLSTIAATSTLGLAGNPLQTRDLAHPIVALSTGPWADQMPHPADESEATDDIQFRFRFAGDTPHVRRALATLRRPRHATQNEDVILIVMESVGTTELTHGDKLDAGLTPHLAELAGSGAFFPYVYTSVPETKRALIHLNTGHSVTWGLSSPELSQPFEGATLAGAFQSTGYRTAFLTSGDLGFAQTRAHLPPKGYNLIFDADSVAPEVRESRRASSWGVEDAVMFERAIAWAEDARRRAHPYFLQLLTLTTHHPYVVPGVTPTEGTTRRDRYRAALTFSDAEIGRFLNDLDARGLLDNAIIAITADHGEAIDSRPGAPRPLRGLHEDCVRTFLLLHLPHRPMRGVSSQRIGSIGDIGATLASLAGIAHAIPGRDLLAADFTPHAVYFQKRSSPTRWGLRAGPWKFIGGIGADTHRELYDLELDPGERHDLAAERSDLVDLFRRMSARWYSDASLEYARGMRLESVQGADFPVDFAAPGPKWLGITAAGEATEPQARFHIDDTAVAHLEIAPYATDTTLLFDWRAADGARQTIHVRVAAGEATATVPCPIPLRRAPGEWRLTVSDTTSASVEATFEVIKDTANES